MRARIWGCRGSLASPGPATVRYGGNTSCVEVRLESGEMLILDAGTGIRELGLALGADPPEEIHLLLTHLHLDHVEGLGFFEPLWSDRTRLHIWGPSSPLRSLEERIARYLSPPLFPLHLSDVPAEMTFHDSPVETWELCGARITALPVSHPGPTLGYRIEEDGRSLAYIPDHEPVLGIELAALSSEWISGYEIAESADVLLHDSQWTEDEYPSRVGWGHSSVAQAVMFALGSSVGRLVLFHHDPARADAALEGLLDRARELWRNGSEPPALAYEGMEVAV